MSKKEQIENVPLHLFSGRFMIKLITGDTFNLEITGGYKDAWTVRDSNGEEGIIPFHAVVLATEIREPVEQETEHEEE